MPQACDIFSVLVPCQALRTFSIQGSLCMCFTLNKFGAQLHFAVHCRLRRRCLDGYAWARWTI
eukprot:12926941-Prorocentrum_lima.AAC.1